MKKFNNNPIQWHEGMYLMPQHFKANDDLHNLRQTYFISTFINFFWGTKELQIDDVALSENVFRILKFEGIMPNGEIVFLSNESCEDLSLEQYADDDLSKEPLKIYLCISTSNSFKFNQQTAQLESLNDDLNQDDAVYIPRVKLDIKLIASRTSPQKYISMAIAEISTKNDALYMTNFIGPSIYFPYTSEVGDVLRSAIAKTRKKITFFSNKLRNSAVDKTDIIMQNFIQSRSSLITNFLSLEHLVKLPEVQPYKLFEMLVGFFSSLCSMSFATPPIIEMYSHDNCGVSIKKILDQIHDTLNDVKENYEEVEFEYKEGVFQCDLPNNLRREDSIEFEVKASSEMTRDEILLWIQSCVIVSASYVHEACDNRVFGADRKIIDKIEDLNIVASQRNALFSISLNDEYINLNEPLMIFNLSENKTGKPSKLIMYKKNAS
jgi:type VI secretion system ImpJ/VasE family protein